MDVLLSDIQDRLSSQVADLKYVDEDWGQLDDYSPNFPVKWPCALIDCFSVNFENMGKKGQLGLAVIRVQVANIKLSNSSGKAPAGQKTNSLSFYLLMKKVYKALHGWAGHNHYSGLIRTSEKRLLRNDGVRVHEMLFTVEIKDLAAMPATVKVPTANFDVEILTQAHAKNPYARHGIGNDVLEDDFTVS